MTKKYFIIIVIILSFQSCQVSRDSDFFTIYLVRHSEKEMNSNDIVDPPLTPCGVQRSESISRFLNDIQISKIYSTNYKRTISTAKPTSLSKKLEIINYEENNLEALSKKLIEAKQDALVVGHSHTTGVLAGLLVDKEIGEMDLDVYNRIYQVVFCKKKGQLHLLNSAFLCSDSIN